MAANERFPAPNRAACFPYFLDPCYYLHIDTRAARVQDSTQQQEPHRKDTGSRGHQLVQKGV